MWTTTGASSIPFWSRRETQVHGANIFIEILRTPFSTGSLLWIGNHNVMLRFQRSAEHCTKSRPTHWKEKRQRIGTLFLLIESNTNCSSSSSSSSSCGSSSSHGCWAAHSPGHALGQQQLQHFQSLPAVLDSWAPVPSVCGSTHALDPQQLTTVDTHTLQHKARKVTRVTCKKSAVNNRMTQR